MSGWVYVITNECIPGFVKVGITQRTLVDRIKDFERSSAAPGQYAVEYAVRVPDPKLLELHAHAKLGQEATEYNMEYHKEWFCVTPKVAAETIKKTISELSGTYLMEEAGNVLKHTNNEPFEYICYKCKTRFTENEAVPFSEDLIKQNKSKKDIDSDICVDCFHQQSEK